MLVACKYSGTVRDAFAKLGWDAWSCDILPGESEGNHVQGDVVPLLKQKWDLIIAHPPCTYLTVTANKWLKDQPARKSGALVGQARRDAVKEAVKFFMLFADCSCPRVAIENPVGVMSTIYRKWDCLVNPWQFGHAETKKNMSLATGFAKA